MSSRKKKTKKQSSEVIPILSLPHDLLLSCIARVSRLYYPTLSLVSKSFRSLVASPELYKARSIINHTESCLYVCLEFPPDEPNQRWFTLCRKPNQTLTNKKKKKSSGYVLVPVPVPSSPTVNYKGLVEVGSDIYAIGGFIDKEGSPARQIQWYDSVVRHWNELKGLKGLPKIGSCSTVKLVACGGNLVLLWDKNVPASGYKEKMIWCAEISLENRNSKEIWGKVEWFDAVLTRTNLATTV